MKTEARKRNKTYLVGIGIVSLMVTVALIAGWFFAFKISAESGKLKSESYYLNQESDKKMEVVQKYNRVSNYQNIVNDTLPSQKEISSFLADVENLANNNKLKINSSMIGAAQKTKAGNLQYSQTIAQKDYYELQIKYEMEGSYSSFLNLLSDLANLRRLNNVSGIDINKLPSDATRDIVRATFVDSIYIKK